MLYAFLKAVAYGLSRLGGVRFEGLENLPASGGVVVASNHRSFWDPVLVAAGLPRPVHFMAKEELFEHRLVAEFLRRINAFPVKRGTADRRALRQALDLLQAGEVVGIFPEGTRSKTGELAKPHNGTGMISLKAGTAVVPVACIGTRKFFPGRLFSGVVIRIGEPVRYNECYGSRLNTTVLEEVSKDIMNRIAFLCSGEEDFAACN